MNACHVITRAACPLIRWLAIAASLAVVSLALAVKSDTANVSATLAPDGGRIVIEAKGVPPPVSVFFSATVDQAIQLGEAEIVNVSTVRIQVRQGRPAVFSLGLGGDGEVTDVTGAGVHDWAVRQERSEAGVRRYLDVRPTAAAADLPGMEVTVHLHVVKPALPGRVVLPLLTAGEAVGFGSTIMVQTSPAIDFLVTASAGLTAVAAPDDARQPLRFTSTSGGRLEVALTRRGAGPAPIELTEAQLTGRVNEAAKSVDFVLRGKLHVTQAGARLNLLAGHAALTDKSAGDGWHIELAGVDKDRVDEIVGEREGVWPIEIAFAATLGEHEGVRGVAFAMPAGTVVPIRIEGLPEKLEFDAEQAVVPTRVGDGWQGYLPADGTVSLAWHE